MTTGVIKPHLDVSMAAISVKRNSFLSRFKALLSSQYFYHKFVEVGNKPQPRDKDSVSKPGEIDISKWKKMDSRSLGITRMMVPSSPYTLLKILRSRGFEAYLVGGCVRDLLLNRTPKDFDVITTADLNQIKKQFHRCFIVGDRFPICRVHIKGSVIEVSSFKTLAKNSEGKEKFLVSQMPRGCDKSDLNLWKNSMHRDFTINSLFFDPLNYKIYDYNNGMKDLLDLKLRTLVPAHLSFTEDCARILRGLRIAARLVLSFSKDIETAIHKQASSILKLNTFRIMMEIDYMLSYGAAESSLSLLHRFNILQILLPFQAAYISRQNSGSGECTMMLMKLFSHMDKLVSCGQPSACILWIGVLAFHQALVNKPQHPFVVLTLGSVLYHQNWNDGLNYARKHGGGLVSFDPETSDPYNFISDEEVAEKVNKLAMLVLDSINVLVDTDSLHKTMSKFPGFPCSGLVFIPKNAANGAAQLFHVLTHKLETYNKGRSSFEMNYELLRKGEASETRFALGKIILNTMGCGTNHDVDNHSKNTHVMPCDLQLRQPNSIDSKKQKLYPKSSNNNKQITDTEKNIEDSLHAPPILAENLPLMPSDSIPIMPSQFMLQQSNAHGPKSKKLNQKSSSSKKQNTATENKIENNEDVYKQNVEVLDTSYCPKIEDHKTNKPEIGAPESQMQELICLLDAVIDNEKSASQLESQNLEERLEGKTEVKVDESIAEHPKETRLVDMVVENDETVVGTFLYSVESNFKRAIQEARDSPAEMRKLNQILINFMEEQVQRNNAKHLKSSSLVSFSSVTSQTEGMELEANGPVTSMDDSDVDIKQLGSCSLVAESTSKICVQHTVESKTTRPKKIKSVNSSIESSMNIERKKRACSYCKEVGHNRTGCPKRKIEEAPPILAENLPLMPSDSIPIMPSDSKLQQPDADSPKKQKLNQKSSSSKKQNTATEKKIEDNEDVYKQNVEVLDTSYCPKIEDCDMEKTEETSVSQLPVQELISTMETITEIENLHPQLEAQQSKGRLHIDAEVQVAQSTTKEQNANKKKTRKQVLPLWSLFK